MAELVVKYTKSSNLSFIPDEKFSFDDSCSEAEILSRIENKRQVLSQEYGEEILFAVLAGGDGEMLLWDAHTF